MNVTMLFLILSLSAYVICLAAAIAFWIKTSRKSPTSRAGLKPPWIAAIGILVAVLLYSIAEVSSGLVECHEYVTQTLLMTLETFTFARDVSVTELTFEAANLGVPEWLYYATGNILYFSASVTTLGAIFSLVAKRFVLRTMWITSKHEETYVFSRVNEPAITLARSIRNNNLMTRSQAKCGAKPPRCQIVFADANLDNDRLLEEVSEEGFKYIDTVASAVVSRCRCRNNTRLHIILSSQREVENLHEGMQLAKRLNRMLLANKLRTRPTIHVFSSSPTAESYVDRMVNRGAKVPKDANAKGQSITPSMVPEIRRIDWPRNVVQQMLLDYPLFLTSALPKNDEEAEAQLQDLYTHSERRIVIVGAGAMGFEFLKAALWCGQSLEVRTFIDIIDKDADSMEQRLRSYAPGLFEAEDGSVFFRFLSYDVNTNAYLDYLKSPMSVTDPYYCPHCCTGQGMESDRITYMLFSLDDDLRNTEVAKRSREVLESCRLRNGTSWKPFIAVVVDDEELADSIRDIENSEQQSYDLVPIGDESVVYSYNNLFCPELEEMARRLNFACRGVLGPVDPSIPNDERQEIKERFEDDRIEASKSYDRYEYNRRSSRASAVFLKYDLYEYCRKQLADSAPRPAVQAWARGDVDQQVSYLATDPSGLRSESFRAVLSAYDKDIEADRQAMHRDADGMVASLMRLEHLRWNAYMRTEGFQTCAEDVFERVYAETSKDQHQLARLHICLVDYDKLPEVDEWYARTLAGNDETLERHFQDNDLAIIQNLSKIVKGDVHSASNNMLLKT